METAMRRSSKLKTAVKITKKGAQNCAPENSPDLNTGPSHAFMNNVAGTSNYSADQLNSCSTIVVRGWL